MIAHACPLGLIQFIVQVVRQQLGHVTCATLANSPHAWHVCFLLFYRRSVDGRSSLWRKRSRIPARARLRRDFTVPRELLVTEAISS
jgi:hypothetical protein